MSSLPATCRSMRLAAPSERLRLTEQPMPVPGAHQVLLRVHACGVCRTDLHLLDGELPQARYPVTPGHEVVGTVVALGAGVTRWRHGDRVGVPWLGRSCGGCRFCVAGQENLCERAEFTGCMLDGGYAEYALADGRYCLPIPSRYSDVQAAPLLCAGLIGYRAWRAAGNAEVLGLYGFGAAAHLIAQVAVAEGQRVVAFTRPGDLAAQDFARELGAYWAGGSDQPPPCELDAAIIFAPVGSLVPTALGAVRRGGRVICAGIHMSDIPSFPYSLLWGERTVASVANLTRRDGEEFMKLAGRINLVASVEVHPLAEANQALASLRDGSLRGAAVLVNQ